MNSMLTQALSPCPFCGGEAEMMTAKTGENAGGSAIVCTRCLAGSAIEFGFKENLISRWESRTNQPPATLGDGVNINYGSILDALDSIPGDIRPEIDHLAKLVREFGKQIGHYDAPIGHLAEAELRIFPNDGSQPEDSAHLECPACSGSGHIEDFGPWAAQPLEQLAKAIPLDEQKIIEGFLNRTGQYLTNDASRAEVVAEARNSALEEAAGEVEKHDKAGRGWVRGSLWDTLSKEASARIRALKFQSPPISEVKP